MTDTTNLLPGAFSVQIASTGALIAVSPDESIVDALRGAGIEVDTSCQAGLCATCKVRYLAGTVEHADSVLDDAERAEYLTLCVSRASSAVLTLDL